MSFVIPFFLHRFSRHQVKVRFVLVGVWNTLFGYGLFCLLDTVFASRLAGGYRAYMAALVISNVLAVVNAFVFHKLVTFRSADTGLKVLPEFMRFSLTYTVSFFLGLVLMPVFVELLFIGTKPAAGMIVVITTVLSYLGHSRYSFNPRGGRAPGG